MDPGEPGAAELPPRPRAGDNSIVGKQAASLVSCVSWVSCLVLVGACGDPEDPFVPPGGVDAPPRVDAAPDGPPDAPPDAPFISPDAPGQSGPPVITLNAPTIGALLSGVIRIEVDVVDTDGVSTVSTTVAGAHVVTMAPVTVNSTIWVGFFDTTALAGLVAPTVIVRATDTTNDSSQIGFTISLDNQPPLASLDPANVRLIDLNEMPPLCSRDFDPVGADAPDDGESVPQLIELRARIADLPNTGTLNTQLYVPLAGVRDAQLVVLDDTTRPLVVDTNADGACDAINPEVVPMPVPMLANEAAVLTLAAVTPSGAAWFGSDTFGGFNAATCLAGSDVDPPASQCLGEPSVTSIIKSFTGDSQIYGIPPITGNNCMGFALDALATNLSDGWACAAVVTTDNLGNRSVSAPLRICIDADGDQAECGSWGTIAAPGVRPSCTGTVTGGVVSATPCTPRDFFRGAPNEYELIDR